MYGPCVDSQLLIVLLTKERGVIQREGLGFIDCLICIVSIDGENHKRGASHSVVCDTKTHPLIYTEPSFKVRFNSYYTSQPESMVYIMNANKWS